MPSKVWDEIIHPFPNFNGCTVEFWEWISNFTLYNGCNYLPKLGLKLSHICEERSSLRIGRKCFANDDHAGVGMTKTPFVNFSVSDIFIIASVIFVESEEILVTHIFTLYNWTHVT